MKQSNVREYVVPGSLGEAVEALRGSEGRVMVLAGGTDVFCADNLEVDILIDITELGLAYIKEEGDALRIGACTTFREIIASQLMAERFGALRDAAMRLADRTIRNVATVGGNICTALPSGDAIPPLYAAGAEIVICSAGGERVVPVEEFFTGPRKTVLGEGELLKEFVLKPHGAREKRGTAFEKVARNSVDIAVSSAAAGVALDGAGNIADIRIALGAVGPTVMRAAKAEQALAGRAPDAALIEEAAALVPGEIAPISNLRSTKEYRGDVSAVLARDAILRAVMRAKGEN